MWNSHIKKKNDRCKVVTSNTIAVLLQRRFSLKFVKPIDDGLVWFTRIYRKLLPVRLVRAQCTQSDWNNIRIRILSLCRTSVEKKVVDLYSMHSSHSVFDFFSGRLLFKRNQSINFFSIIHFKASMFVYFLFLLVIFR